MNPRAGYPTYSLSRGAPSPLGYFCMVIISFRENARRIYYLKKIGHDPMKCRLAERVGFEPTVPCDTTVFKTVPL